MTVRNTSGNWPVAPKVKWGALGAAVLGFVLTMIPALLTNGDIITGVPDWVFVILGTLLPASGSAGAGYSAPHQLRPGGSTGSGGVA